MTFGFAGMEMGIVGMVGMLGGFEWMGRGRECTAAALPEREA